MTRMPIFVSRLTTWVRQHRKPLQWVFIGFLWNVLLGLGLWHRLRDHNTPIQIRMSDKQDLTLLISKIGEANKRNLSVSLAAFFSIQVAFTKQLLFDGINETLARTIRTYYQRTRKQGSHTCRYNPVLLTWNGLPDSIKERNQQKAGDMNRKLKAIGCGLLPIKYSKAPTSKLKSEEIDLLMRMEHERWCAKRRREDWRHTPGEKDTRRKLHPSLVSWDKPTGPEKAKNHLIVDNIAALSQYLTEHTHYSIGRLN